VRTTKNSQKNTSARWPLTSIGTNEPNTEAQPGEIRLEEEASRRLASDRRMPFDDLVAELAHGQGRRLGRVVPIDRLRLTPAKDRGGRMGCIMDRRLRRAPDAEWVLMYRLGLSRARIAALVRVPPAAVGYHLVIARRQDPGLEAEHQAAAGAAPVPCPSPGDLARMEEVTAWILAEGRLPAHPVEPPTIPDSALGRCVVQPEEPVTVGTPAVNLLNASSAC
jgi:hypothetical protein